MGRGALAGLAFVWVALTASACNLDFETQELPAPTSPDGVSSDAADTIEPTVDATAATAATDASAGDLADTTVTDTTVADATDSEVDAETDAAPILCDAGCGADEVCCGDVCVDVSSSAEHCGACDAACGGTCVGGACCAPANGCAELGAECGRVDDGCGGMLTCGNSCPFATVCDANQCATPTFQIPDTVTEFCVSDAGDGSCPAPGEPFYGQDGTYRLRIPTYTINGAGEIFDSVTGLRWQHAGVVGARADAMALCQTLGTGWRAPTYFELATIVDYGRVPVLDPIFGVDPGANVVTITDNVNLQLPGGRWGPLAGGDVLCVAGDVAPVNVEVVSAEAAQDRGRGLMWTSTARAPASWEDALAACEALTLDGYDDWRMPTLVEGVSLYVDDPGAPDVLHPAFDDGGASELWTGTPSPEHPPTRTGAVIRSLSVPAESNVPTMAEALPYLCVRDLP